MTSVGPLGVGMTGAQRPAERVEHLYAKRLALIYRA
jgi:hypothetical protein